MVCFKPKIGVIVAQKALIVEALCCALAATQFFFITAAFFLSNAKGRSLAERKRLHIPLQKNCSRAPIIR